MVTGRERRKERVELYLKEKYCIFNEALKVEVTIKAIS